MSGIPAKHAAFNPFVTNRLNSFLLPLQGSFSNARESCIGAQPNEKIIAQPSICHKRFKPSDFHSLLLIERNGYRLLN